MGRRIGTLAAAVALIGLGACGDRVVDDVAGPTTLPGPEPAIVLRSKAETTPEQLSAAADILQRRLVEAGLADALVQVDPGSGLVNIDVADDDEDVVLEQIRPRTVLLRPVIGCNPDASGSTGSGDTTELVPILGGGACVVGAAMADGTVFEPDAEPQIIAGSWGLSVSLRSGAGTDQWNAIARLCFEGAAECPSRQLAIEVDGTIISSPVVNVPEFAGTVEISGDFTEAQARELANVLLAGAIGVEWIVQD